MFPNAFAPTTNTASNNAWGVSIASDGASGSDLTITSGPTITGQVDGANATILLQTSAVSTPAPSTSNGGLNRFGDNANNSPIAPATAAAVWRLRTGGVWVINLPTCAPSSFPTAPATLAFEACAGMGIGMFLNNAGATPIDALTLERCQVQIYVLNTEGITFQNTICDSQVANADMTSHSSYFDQKSSGCKIVGAYAHGSYYGHTQNLTVTSQGRNNSSFVKMIGRDFSDRPVGGSDINVLAGPLSVQGCDVLSTNINVTAGGETVIFANTNFGTGTLTVNGQTTNPPSNLLMGPGNLNPPSFVPGMTDFT